MPFRGFRDIFHLYRGRPGPLALLGAVLVLALLVVIGVVALWPSREAPSNDGQGSRTRYFTARVDPRVSGVLINARAAIDAANTRPARSMTTLYPKAGLPPVTG